ncbi:MULTISPECIES: RNA polymerase sigma factor [unclassified Knoellia]|uniref:RNA polymerase sigma factor n=1 Tax=Knoellia altitudinis TaxID=3404795 RepID=UPI0036245131
MSDARVSGGDSELMQRVSDNDRDALAEVYQRFGGLVHTIALRSVGEHHDAEDITQQVFLALWRSRGRLDTSTGSLAGWLATVTRRRCADHHEARARNARHEQMLAAQGPERPRAPDPEDAAERVLLAHELAALGDPRATIIRMAIIEDRRQQDIAEALDLPLGTVKSHIRRGLLDLRSRLKEVTP